MNILIIASYYEQDKNIASVRWTNFAYRLAQRHRIYVLAEPLSESAKKVERYQSTCGITVMRMNQQTLYEKISQMASREKIPDTKNEALWIPEEQANHFLRSMIRKVKNRFCLFADYLMAMQQTEYVLEQMNNDQLKFDVVISSARPLRQFVVGALVAKRLHCAWVSDFRDLPFTSWSDPDDIRLRSKLLLKYTPLATVTTLISKGMCEAFIDINHIPEESAKRVQVLSNGFSDTDAKAVSETANEPNQDNSQLTIAYTGTLYEHSQDAGILFSAIAALFQENKMTHTGICIEYAGDAGSILQDMAKKFGISSVIHDNGYVSRQAALKIQNEADLLLVLTWNTYLARGILTGKMYEYILSQKPIICITAGDIPNSEATETIRKYHLGIACETMSFNEDVAALKEYLLMQLKRKQQGQNLEYHAAYEALQEFNHDQLALKLENLCLEAVKEKEKDAYLHCSGLVSGK